jgi:hypothetical protein
MRQAARLLQQSCPAEADGRSLPLPEQQNERGEEPCEVQRLNARRRRGYRSRRSAYLRILLPSADRISSVANLAVLLHMSKAGFNSTISIEQSNSDWANNSRAK